MGAGAGAAAVTSVLGMYAAAGPYAGAPNYSAFLPYAADLSLFTQMVSAPGPLSRAALRRRDPGARAKGAGAPVRRGGGGGERGEASPVTARPVGLGKRGDGRPGPRGGSGWESGGPPRRPGASGPRRRSGQTRARRPRFGGGGGAGGRVSGGAAWPHLPGRPFPGRGPRCATFSALGLGRETRFSPSWAELVRLQPVHPREPFKAK